MKTQINNLVNGTFGIAGTPRVERMEIASKVISENKEGMTILMHGYKLDLIANWSLSRKSVTYSSDIPLELYRIFCGEYNLPKVNPRASILINGDMTIMFITNSRKQKMAYSYIKESEIEIL